MEKKKEEEIKKQKKKECQRNNHIRYALRMRVDGFIVSLQILGRCT